MKIIAIGGVACSMSAASRLKRYNKSLDIIVYEKGESFSYGACGMPYYISDEVKSSDTLVVKTKQQFIDSGMHVFSKHEVLAVDPTKKEILVKNLETGDSFLETYDKLIIGTGASAILPALPNIHLENIVTLHVLEDSIDIKERLEKAPLKKATVIGGGFVGIEMVEAFLTRGMEVTLVHKNDHLLNTFDPEISSILEEHLVSKGVTLRLGEMVQGFEGNKKVETVITDKGSFDADIVLFSIGIQPNTKFLDGSGIVLGEKNAIDVNPKMQTNLEDIYAGGDCATIYNLSHKENNFLPMGTNANKQGRIIADNILGKETSFKGVLGTMVIKVVDMEAAKTGLTEKEALRRGIPHKTVMITGKNHAHYYPNAQPITVKIIYSPDTLVMLGAELAGYSDTVLRIDTLAIAIQKEMTTREFGYVDMGYAPPYASVWDVIQIAANKAK